VKKFLSHFFRTLFDNESFQGVNGASGVPYERRRPKKCISLMFQILAYYKCIRFEASLQRNRLRMFSKVPFAFLSHNKQLVFIFMGIIGGICGADKY
jgi:hypothetical protein